MTDKTTAALKLAEQESCKECGAKQAQIDRLMLEYCPDEMTPEQMQEWERNIKPFVEPVKQEPVVYYAYATIKEYEELAGFSVSQAFRAGWNMARTTNSMLGINAAPVSAKREWADLTDDEMWDVFISKDWTGEPLQLMSAAIAAFKEKNK